MEQPFRLFQGRLDGVCIHLLHYQRNGYYHVWLHVLHGLEQRGRRGCLSKEVDGDAIDVRVYELNHKSVHVGHRQHRDDGLAGFVGEVRVAELIGVGKGSIGEHHALGIASGAGCVVDDGQLIHVLRGVGEVAGFQSFRIALGKDAILALPGIGHALVAVPKQTAILHVDGGLQHRHLLGIELAPDVFIGEKQDAVGVVCQRRDSIGVEVGEQRHGYTFVDVDFPESQCPAGTIAGADGHLATLGDSCFGQEEPKLLNLCCYVCVGEGFATVVAECLLAPSGGDCFLKFL